MPKNHLTLYIDTELIDLAKATGMNISAEFNEWMKIRMNKLEENKKEPKDVDMLIAEHRAEIMKLQSQAEIKAMQSEKDKEINIIISDVVDNILKEKKDGDAEGQGQLVGMTWPQIITYRSTGLMFLVKKRMNKILTLTEAEQILTDEIKKRGIEI